jgi:hypothetical protein
MKSSFHSLIPFLPLFCNGQFISIPLLPSSYSDIWRLETPLTLNWTLLYNDFARTTQKTQFFYRWEGVLTAPLHSNGSYSTCLRIRCRGNVFTKSLPSNEHVFWLHYSGYWASCHNIFLTIPIFSCGNPLKTSFKTAAEMLIVYLPDHNQMC